MTTSTYPDVFQGSSTYPRPSPRPVVTIGNFDGVHRGHRALIDRTVERARAAGRPALVLTFHPAPRDVLRPDNDIPRIQILEDRLACLGEAGADQVVVEPFTLELSRLAPRAFAEQILRDRLEPSALVLGYDFRFGRGRQGTVDDLRRWLEIPVDQVQPFAPDGEPVSSSRIRMAVRDGRLAEAAGLLGRPHSVVGRVVRGDARGRELGFPTANIDAETELLPAHGVYVVRVQVGDDLHGGVANVGTRPTFGDDRTWVEVHLFDFEGDLYGEQVRARFLRRLRDERAFDSKQALVEQIERDARQAREHLEQQ